MDLTLSLNHNCNLVCSYCYGGKKSNRPMSFETAQKALDIGFAYPSAGLRLHFFGGEPLLEFDLMKRIVAEAERGSWERNKPLRMGLTTNGTILSDEAIEFFKEKKFNLTISIDGVERAHNRHRRFADGTGSYEVVKKRLEAAIKALGPVNTLSVIHPDTLEDLSDSFNLIASYGVRRISFSPDYDAEWDEEALRRLEESLQRLADRAIDHYRKGNHFTIQPFHTKIVSRLKGGLQAEDKCDFGCAELAVAPSGNLYPCDRLIGDDGPRQDDIRIGHVRTGVDSVKVRKLKQAKDASKPECRDCAIIDRCVFWCGCVNRSLTGRVDQVSGLLCQFEKMGIRIADRMASTLFSERNVPFIRRYYIGPSAVVGKV